MKRKLLLAASLSIALTGCGYLNSTTRHTTRTFRIGTNVVTDVTETTHGRAWTFLDASSMLTKFRNASSVSIIGTNQYAPGTFASGLNESSSSTNLTTAVNAMANAVTAVANAIPK